MGLVRTALKAITPSAETAVGKLLISGKGGLEKIGPEALQGFKLIEAADELGSRLYTPHIDELNQLFRNSDPAVVSGLSKELSSGPPTTAVGNVSMLKMREVYDKFLQKGLVKSSNFIPNYWPRMYDQSVLKDKDSLDRAVKHLVSTGQVRNPDEALDLIKMTASGGRRFSNIERRRIADFPGYRTDSAVVTDYLHKGYKRLAEVDTFGPKDEALTDVLSQVRQKYGDTAYRHTKWLYESKLGRSIGLGSGYKGTDPQDWEQAMATYQGLTKLSLSAIGQAGQILNIPLVVRGVAPVVRGMAHTLADYGDARKLAVDAGAIGYEVLRDAHAVTKSALSQGLNKVAFGGLSTVESALRVVASNTGKYAAQDSFERLVKNPGDSGARTVLQTLGVNIGEALKNKALSNDDILSAARRASDISQFRPDVGSVPPAWRTSPYGRVLTMYKHYAYQQSKFLKDYVIKPALAGDLKPLTFMALLFPAFGEVMSDLSEYVRKGTIKDRPDTKDYPLERVIDNVSHVGAFGIMYDMARLMGPGNRNAAWSFLFGPVMSDVVDLHDISTNFDFGSSHPLDKMSEAAKKKLTRAVPVIGPRLYQDYYGKPQRGFLAKGKLTKGLKKMYQKATGSQGPVIPGL